MEKFQKFSSRIVIVLALLWAVLVVTGQLPIGYSYLILGALSAYIGVQNMILLNWGQRTGQMPSKITYLIQRHGNNKGIMQYVVVNVLLFLLIGLAVMYCGYQLISGSSL